MFKFTGKIKHSGIVIAQVAVVDVMGGINSVDPDLLERGMQSLRRQLSSVDYPEVVIACDSLAVGLTTQLPGLSTVGVAAESDTSSITASIPCVAGVDGLLASLSKGDLIIVDGNEGVVYVDPDTDTLIKYQQLLGHSDALPRYRIDAPTLPVTTASGETVLVYAAILTWEDLAVLSSDCPDGLLKLMRYSEGVGYADVMRAAAGRQTWIVLSRVTSQFLSSVHDYGAPGQVTAVFDPTKFNKGLIDIAITASVVDDFKTGDFETPWFSTGITTKVPELLENFEVSRVLLMGGEWEKAVPEILEASIALRGKSAENVMIYLGDSLELIPAAISRGFRCIAVTSGLAREAKELIKTIS